MPFCNMQPQGEPIGHCGIGEFEPGDDETRGGVGDEEEIVDVTVCNVVTLVLVDVLPVVVAVVVPVVMTVVVGAVPVVVTVVVGAVLVVVAGVVGTVLVVVAGVVGAVVVVVFCARATFSCNKRSAVNIAMTGERSRCQVDTSDNTDNAVAVFDNSFQSNH